MKAANVCLIGLVFVVSVSAESLLEGRVRLDSGEPVVDAQVRIFDMTDLRQGAIARAMTDGTGYFALPLATLGGRALPERFTLGPNYPNPFNPSTIIPYQLAASAEVRLEVFNLLGQHLATLVDGVRPAGFHTATWTATDAAGRAVGAGVYIYRMTVGAASQTGRMVLIDGQAGVSTAGAASVWSGASGGGSDGAGEQVYGLIVSGEGLVPYVDSSFRVEAGMTPVELVVSSGHHSAGKVTDLFDALNDAEEEEETRPSGKAQATLEAPAAPTNLRFEAVTDSSCRVRWDAAEGATDYDVNYKPAVGGRWTNEPHRGIRLYNTIHDLEPGTEYRWAVRAENGDGRSAWVFGPNFTTLEEEETDRTSSAGGPDLIVQSPSASAVVLTPGQAFTLQVTVHNQGDQQAAATMLHYYRSNNTTITTSDTEVGTGAVDALAASATSEQSIALTASVGVEKYYGACVASVSGESNTDNNCSSAVKITVSGQEATEEESSETGEGDLIVSASINDDILTTRQAFILRARVQNQGTDEAQALVLSYYRSSNATISTQDMLLGTDEVGSLAASSIGNKSIRLTAPSTPGIYYYGTCVERKSGESDTPSNCSTGVRVTIEEARTTASEFLLICPTPDEVEDIDRDLELVFIDDPTAGWPLACTAEEGSVDLSVLQMGTYQTLRLMKAVEFAEPLPWTTSSLYDWFVSTVSAIDVDANSKFSHAVQSERKIVLSAFIETDAETGRMRRAPSWIFWYHNDKSRLGEAAVSSIQLYVHEARHVEGPDHTCDGGRDQTFAEMGSWAYAYYTLLWFLEDKAVPTDFFSSVEREALRSQIADLCSFRFCQEGCP